MIKDTFCVLPWTQVVIRSTGSIAPCCPFADKSNNIRKTSIQDFFSSNYMDNIRNKMIKGEPVAACESCYDDERLLNASFRKNANRDAKFFSPKHYSKLLERLGYDEISIPSRIELHVGNICNLKCLTCKPQNSSLFLAEDKILGISDHDQKHYDFNQSLLEPLRKILTDNKFKILDLRGGESLLVPAIKDYLSSLDDAITCNRTLRIQTNGTVFDEEWHSIFRRFNKVEIMISIDAFGDDNKYLRFPADWNVITHNIERFKKIENVDFYLNVTISNLSFLVLNRLLAWITCNDIHCSFYPVTDPDYYHVLNLPTELLSSSLMKIEEEIKKNDYLQSNEYLSGIVQYVKNHKGDLDVDKWKTFCKMISRRDKHRKNSVFDLEKNLQSYWVKD